MKKNKLLLAVSSLLLIAAILFSALWIHEKNDLSDFRETALREAAASYAAFNDFRQTASDASYWQGVASFYAFEQSYHRYTEDTGKTFNFTVSNEVYGSLLCSPEKCKAHIAEIADIMRLLSANIEDANAYEKMANLRNLLSE